MTRTTATESLYGARSHESALFSVSSIDEARGAPTPSSETSCTIDVRTIAASSALDHTPPLMRMETTPAPKTRSRKGGLYVMTAALGLGLISSLTAIASPPRAAPAVSTAGFELEDSASAIFDEPFEDGVVILAVEEADEEDDEMPEPVVEPEPEPEPKAKAKRKSAKSKAAKAKARKKAAAKPAAKEPAKAPAKVASDALDPMSADCLLNPAKCKVPKAAPAEEAPAKPSVSLPEKLSTSALKAGISGTKDRAERVCEDLASSGDKVQVKLSIRGTTGSVTSAVAQGAAASTKLGACVARELAKSTFDRFVAPQQGLIATVRF